MSLETLLSADSVMPEAARGQTMFLVGVKDGDETTLQILKALYNAGFVYVASLGAGERNIASASNSYMDTRRVSMLTTLAKSGAIPIGSGIADTHLRSIQIHTALAGTLTITGFADSDGVATSIVYPIGTAAGVYNFDDALNTAGQLTFTLSSATDYTTNKSVNVRWRPA